MEEIKKEGKKQTNREQGGIKKRERKRQRKKKEGGINERNKEKYVNW